MFVWKRAKIKKENVLHPPETMDFDAKSLSQTWKKWEEEVRLYIDISMDKKSEAQKVKLLLISLDERGEKSIARCNSKQQRRMETK